MSEQDKLPQKHTNIRSLTPDQRAGLSYLCFIAWATEGTSFSDLSKTHNITVNAVKILIEEHSAHERAGSNSNKAASAAAYRYLMSKSKEIMENPAAHPALVRAKAPETYLQARTRLDKLEGTESPQLNISASEETIADWKRRAQKSGDLAQVSPVDHAIVEEGNLKPGEIVEEGEIVD